MRPIQLTHMRANTTRACQMHEMICWQHCASTVVRCPWNCVFLSPSLMQAKAAPVSVITPLLVQAEPAPDLPAFLRWVLVWISLRWQIECHDEHETQHLFSHSVLSSGGAEQLMTSLRSNMSNAAHCVAEE